MQKERAQKANERKLKVKKEGSRAREHIPQQIVSLAMKSVRIRSDKRFLTSFKSTDPDG